MRVFVWRSWGGIAGLAATVLLSAIAPTAAGAQAKDALGPGKEAPFRHSSHVPGAWARWDTKDRKTFELEEETADCFGCHDPDNPTGIESPLCLRCHYTRFEAQGTRPQTSEKGALFQHREHANNLVCRHCHSPREEAAAKRGAVLQGSSVPDDMSVVSGTTFCLACHGPQAKDIYTRWVAPERNDAVIEAAERRISGVISRLNDSPELGPKKYDGVGFFHRDHIAGWPPGTDAARAAAGATCKACHESVAGTISLCEALKASSPGAGPDVGPAVGLGAAIFDTKSCASCHIERGAGGETAPLALGVGERSWKSATAGTFSHRDHLRNPEPGKLRGLDTKRKLIGEKGCYVCHELSEAADSGLATYGVRAEFAPSAAGKSGYDACASCHESWKVLARAGSRGEKDHFAIRGDTSVCAGCHRLGHVTDMRAIPYTVKVTRPRELSFEIREHAHEFITGREKNDTKSAAVAEECSKCHRADLAAQPSRVRKSRFSHASHLPREATPGDCARCHAGIEATKSPEEIGSEKFALYDSKACTQCHKDVALEPQRDAKAAEIEVPLFAHADHVGKTMPDGSAVSCDTCHESKLPDGTRAVGVLEKAAKCVTCHDHGKNAGITGGASAAYVANCVACHTAGVPASGTSIAAASRIAITGILGEQLHPLDTPCKDCHAAGIAGEPLVRGKQSPEFLSGRGWYEGARAARGGFHDDDGGNKFSSEGCYCCHWANQGESRERYRRPRGMEEYTLRVLRLEAGKLLAPGIRDGKFPGRECAGR